MKSEEVRNVIKGTVSNNLIAWKSKDFQSVRRLENEREKISGRNYNRNCLGPVEHFLSIRRK